MLKINIPNIIILLLLFMSISSYLIVFEQFTHLFNIRLGFKNL